MAVDCALLGAREDGADTQLLDLAAYDLPFLGSVSAPAAAKAVERFLADLPVDPEVRDRLKSVGRQVAHFARLHKCENHHQFLKEWEGAAGNDDRGDGTR